MLKWFLALAIALVVLTVLSPWLSRYGLGRLPGDLTVRYKGRLYYLPPTLRQHDRAFARPDAAGAAPLRRLRRPRGEALLERSELLAHRSACEHLRVGGRIAFRPLPVVYRLFRSFERLDQRKRVAQRFIVERLAEPGVFAVVIAAEGGVKRVGGGDDEGVVVLEGLDEPPGETGRDHDHLPLDAAVGEHARERARRELRELERREI